MSDLTLTKGPLPAYDEETLEAAHDHSFLNEEALKVSTNAGCFSCGKVFPANIITRWCKERQGGRTAVCPHCSIDSVIADSSGLPLTPAFLQAMEERWFSYSED